MYLPIQDGDTPLSLASKTGHLSTVQVMVEAGADVTIPDNVCYKLFGVSVHQLIYIIKIQPHRNPCMQVCNNSLASAQVN